MTNLKKKDFYNVITGEDVNKESYGINASTFKRVINVDMVFDSRGQYIGIRTCRGKFENNKYIPNKGIHDFKSFSELMIWNNQKCTLIEEVKL